VAVLPVTRAWGDTYGGWNLEWQYSQ